MEKIAELLKKLGIEFTADQTAQIKEVVEKEFVPAADHAAQKTKLDESTKQLAERDKCCRNRYYMRFFLYSAGLFPKLLRKTSA